MEPAVSGMATIISNIGLFVTASVGWVGDTIATFTSTGNELLLVPFYIGLVGIGAGLVRRFVKVFR